MAIPGVTDHPNLIAAMNKRLGRMVETDEVALPDSDIDAPTFTIDSNKEKLTMPDTIEQPAPAALIPLVLPPACFITPVVHEYKLAHPVRFAGRDWHSIHIRRLSTEQIEVWQENNRANQMIQPGFFRMIPIFVDDNGVDVPHDLLSKLDGDDNDKLGTASLPFLPQRFTSIPQPENSNSLATPEAGATTSTHASE